MNIWDLESDYIERWGTQVPTLEIKTTFHGADWTGINASAVSGQVVFDGIESSDEIRAAALLRLRYSAHVFLDAARASPADKTLAAQAVDAALRSATGWEPVAGRVVALAGGQRTGFDGRLVRVSVSFLVPAVALGLA